MIAASNEVAQRYTLSVCALGRVALAHREGLIPAVSRGWPCLKAVIISQMGGSFVAVPSPRS